MADTNVVIGAKLQVDASGTTEASKSIKEMKDNVKDLQKAFDNAKQGSAEQAKAYQNLKAAQDTLKKSQTELNNAAKDGAGHFAKLKEGIASVPGPLNGVSEGAGKVNSIFKVLAGNPLLLILTAIVAVLTLLYKAFTNTFEGAQKVEQIFSGIKAAAQALFDNIGHLASAVVKFFTFDFSGAVNEIKQVVGAATDAYNKMSALTKQAQELHKEQLANDLDQAERAKRLAILREQASDEDITPAKRKAALLELKKDAEQNAKDDIDLAKRTTENKIAQLTLQKDGAKKNQDEINKLKIEQINVETENANELRRIDKQVTAANKQELAERKAAEDKAREEAKKRREELIEFTNKLQKLQQENDLALIADTYEKEKKQIENKIADDKRANALSFQDKKINAAQLAQLDAELDKSRNLQLDALTKKHNEEVADKEAAFQKELAGIRAKASVSAIIDQREAERVQLQITYQQQLADAAKNYKDNADRLAQIRTALAEQQRADQQKLEEKFRKEDAEKRFKQDESDLKAIQEDRQRSFEDRQKAVDADLELVQQAFDAQVISEVDYNNKIAELTKARMSIRDEEQKHHERVSSAIADGLGNLSEIAGKQTLIGKAFAVAQTTIDTISSSMKAFNALADIPVVGPALGAIAAAAAIARGVKAVKDIVSVQVPGKGSGGGSSSIPSTAAPSAPVTPARVSTTFTGAQASSTGTATSTRAYVVGSDIRDENTRNEQLNRAARLGGG
jgi:hypothetical protein